MSGQRKMLEEAWKSVLSVTLFEEALLLKGFPR
jgi:hypothetical protein